MERERKPGFRGLPRRVQALVVVQAAAAVGVALTWWKLPPPDYWLTIALLMMAGALGGICKVRSGLTISHMSLGFTVSYFGFLMLGPEVGVLTGFASILSARMLRWEGKRWRLRPQRLLSCQTVYNLSNGVLLQAAMAGVFTALGGRYGESNVAHLALPCLASAGVGYVVNAVGVGLASVWAEGKPFWTLFRREFLASTGGFLASASLGVGALWAYQSPAARPVFLLLLPPIYLVYYSRFIHAEKHRNEVEHARRIAEIQGRIVSGLAAAIDAKDSHTHKHLSRVQEYAARLAEKVGVPDEERDAIRVAAILHDIGKIGIPESILGKPGKLTPEEYEIIKSHVEIGALILEEIDFPWPVVPAVRSHHERWDGLGYPDGLKGEAIPIGGRIISLVDVFDALTSDRPYRRAMTVEQAIEVLRANRGTQFDPTLVDAFIEILEEHGPIPEEPEPESARRLIELLTGAAHRAQAPGAIREEAVNEEEVFAEIERLLAAQGEIGALIPALAECVSRLAPCTTFVLYLLHREQRTLVPAHTAGLWTQLFEGLEIRLGEGVAGLVAATGQPIVNASAGHDLLRRVPPGQNLELSSTLCVPLVLGEEAVGALSVYHTGYNFYRDTHARRLTRVAEMLAGARGLVERLLPDRDPVTGLPDALALTQFLQGQLALAQTREEEVALLLLAVDPADGAPERTDPGRTDRTMRTVGRLLREFVRDWDYVARYSDRCFAVVLPRCGERIAMQIAERLLHSPGLLALDGADWRISLGRSFYPLDGSSAPALLGAAEQRLQAHRDRLLRALPTGRWVAPPRSYRRSRRRL